MSETTQQHTTTHTPTHTPTNTHQQITTSVEDQSNSDRPNKLKKKRKEPSNDSLSHLLSKLQPVAHIPSLFFLFSFTTSQKGFPCSDNGPLWQRQPSHQAWCISWHIISRAMWQLKATLAGSQSCRKRDTFSPEKKCLITLNASLSSLCSGK